MRNKKGVSLLWVAIASLVLFGIGAFAVDLGSLWLVRNELQNTADAAALAAASGLGQNYREVRARARAWAAENVVAGKPLMLNLADEGGDIEVGVWDTKTRTFTPSNPYAVPMFENNAVRVKAARTYDSNGPINLVFGRLLGKDAAELTASAVAIGRPAPVDPQQGGAEPRGENPGDNVLLPTPNHGGGGIPIPKELWDDLSDEDKEKLRWAAEHDPYVMYVMDTTDSLVAYGEESKELAQSLLEWSEASIVGKLITRVGLVSFESKPYLEQELSTDVSKACDKIKGLSFGREYPEAGNNAKEGLKMAIGKLWNEDTKGKDVDKMAFLFSDGNFSAEEKAAILEIAKQAKQGKENPYGKLEPIPFYVFGIGKDVKEDILREIAEASGGSYLKGEDALAMCQESMGNYLVWLVR